jgi:hypothetical protein
MVRCSAGCAFKDTTTAAIAAAMGKNLDMVFSDFVF